MGFLRGIICLALCSLALALQGCARITLDKAKSDMAAGRLLAAERHLALLGDGKSAHALEAQALLKELRRERSAALEFLVSLARVERGRLEQGDGSYTLAVGYAAAGLEFAAPEDDRAELQTLLAHLQAAWDAEIQAYRSDYTKANKLLDDCDEAEAEELLLALASRGARLGRAEHGPLALRAAQSCLESASYADAVRLFAFALGQKEPVQAVPSTALAAMAIARVRAGESLEPAASTPAKVQRSTRKRLRRPHPTAAADKGQDSSAQEQKKSYEGPRVDEILQRLQSQLSVGNRFEALLQLDEAIERWVGGDEALQRLEARRTSLEGERQSLVGELLRVGERALRDEKADLAYDSYRRILALMPEHPVANDRMRKLQALRTLQQKK